jgi:predicted  nucleic acid-binding Zn-ribbon protein
MVMQNEYVCMVVQHSHAREHSRMVHNIQNYSAGCVTLISNGLSGKVENEVVTIESIKESIKNHVVEIVDKMIITETQIAMLNSPMDVYALKEIECIIKSKINIKK